MFSYWQGVAGAVVRVRDKAGGEVGKSVSSSERGEFWKLLLPGQYTVRIVLVFYIQ